MIKSKKTLRLTAFIITLALVTVLVNPAAFKASATPNGIGIFVDFEDGTTMGFEGRDSDGIEVLKATNEKAFSGTYSLLTTGRTKAWHGPSLNVTEFALPGRSCEISVMVHAKTPDESRFKLSTQVGQGPSASYHNLHIEMISVSDGWVQLKGTFTYPEDDYITIYVENDTVDAEFYIDDVIFIIDEDGGFYPDLSLPSLAEVYKDYFLIGTAFTRSDLTSPRLELVRHHFNVLTAENAMKPNALSNARGEYSFERVDAMLDQLEQLGILVHGHALVWHSQSPNWLNKDDGGQVLTRAEARANMEEFITTVAGHYAGRVISWDVVNEAFNSSVGGRVPEDWRDALRTGGRSNDHSAWYGAYDNGADEAAGESGADYIYDAFVFTRLADPNAILYYNDFNETEAGKREVIALMTEELNELWKNDPRNTEPGRLLIEGLGLQGHYWTDDLDPQNVEDTIARWIETGAEISITELDIPAGRWNNYRDLTEDQEELKQAKLYAQLFMIFKKYSDFIERVTIWGIDDNSSWRREGSPLLFTANGMAKSAFTAVADPEGFLTGMGFDLSGYYDNKPVKTPEPTPSPATPAPPVQAEPSPVPDDEPETAEEPPQRNILLIILISAGAALVAMIIVSLVKKKIGLK